MISCITYADKNVDNTNGATNNYNLIKLSIYF